MDNLPNLQRSVRKFFDSRRKSQKRQRAATTATLEINSDQQLKTDRTTATTIVSNVSTYQASFENTIITTAPTPAAASTSITISTGAIKKKTSIRSHNEKNHNKLRFFSRNSSSEKKPPQQHLKLSRTASTTTTECFPHPHVNSSTYQLVDLDKPNQILEGVRSEPHLNVRSAHFALAQLHSSDVRLGFGGQMHDSPEEPTTEFAYQHLGSAATTNSNTSLEFSFGELGDTTAKNNKPAHVAAVSNTAASNVCYWAWQQTIATVASSNGCNDTNNVDLYAMTTKTSNCGTSVSTAANIATKVSNMNHNLYTETFATTTATTTPTTTTTTTIAAAPKSGKRSPLLKMPVIKQLSSQPSTTDEQEETMNNMIKTTRTGTSSKPPSRSGSASKLMNFLFKSSNESSKSLQGQSNEGFTASSHGSSSGEWEYLGAVSGMGHARLEIESLPEETQMHYLETDEAGSYFQYTLSSPNNPFLPEIVARSYHSTYDSQEFELPPKTHCIMHTHSQLSTPAYSRAGSQESTHSEGAMPPSSNNNNIGPTSISSRAGRQRRKLFSLHSPRFLQQRQQEPPVVINAAVSESSTFLPITTTTTSIVPLLGGEATRNRSDITGEHSSLMRGLNPFSSSARRASSHCLSPKRGSQSFSSKVNTPATMSADLGAKREELLRATMKICLVVSPPNNKLQVNGVFSLAYTRTHIVSTHLCKVCVKYA